MRSSSYVDGSAGPMSYLRNERMSTSTRAAAITAQMPLPARRRTSAASKARRRERWGLGFVTPFFILFLCFTLAPLGYAIYTSFFTDRLIGGLSFVGFANYETVFTDGTFWSGMVRVLIFAAIQIPVMLGLAFFFAVVFDLGIARFGPFFRTVFFIPFAVPSVVGSVMWSFLLLPQFGPFTHLAEAFGFSNVNYFSPSLILPTIIVIVIWQWTGYNMIILYTALKSVPNETVEAAVVDGASITTIALRIKLPGVRLAIIMLVFLNLIGSLQLFTEPSILGNFQPQAISFGFTPSIFVYNTAIGLQQYYLGAAAAVVLGLVTVVISLFSIIVRYRRGDAT
jgi:multiple sugar transport system permease protein